MKSNKLWKFGALCALIASLLIPAGYGSPAQASSQGPAKALWIIKEEIKPGKLEAYRQLQEQYIDTYEKANFAFTWVGLIPSVDTSHNEATFCIELNSLSDMDLLNQEFLRMHVEYPELLLLERHAQELVVGQQEALSVLRPELSVEAGATTSSLRRGGRLQISTVRLQPGKEQEWTKAVGDSAVALRQAGASEPSLIYQVISGDKPGTFMVLSPLKPTDGVRPTRERARAIGKALGAEQGERLAKVLGNTVLQEESSVYSVDPKLSLTR
jgi:hypothetical protein